MKLFFFSFLLIFFLSLQNISVSYACDFYDQNEQCISEQGSQTTALYDVRVVGDKCSPSGEMCIEDEDCCEGSCLDKFCEDTDLKDAFEYAQQNPDDNPERPDQPYYPKRYFIDD